MSDEDDRLNDRRHPYVDRVIDALADPNQRSLADALAVRGLLSCVECGLIDDGVGRGWTRRLDVNGDPAVFCPECDAREFGNA